jgi:uncharacterized protein (TIGR04255 family)
MAEVRHLTRAPIKEAVIDFRCLTGAKVDSVLIRKLGAEIGYDGESQEMRTMSWTWQQGVSTAPTAKTSDHGVVGCRFFSKDKKFVVQMRLDGMTFSRLPPYTAWDNVFPEVSRLWTIFCANIQVVAVSRIAVRNINRVLLPQVDFSKAPSDFLIPPPSAPKGADEDCIISQWMSRFVINNAAKDITAIVTQLSDSTTDSPDQYALIFDIDVFTEKDLPLSPELLLPRFARLRELKNRIFFSAITDRTLELFK